MDTLQRRYKEALIANIQLKSDIGRLERETRADGSMADLAVNRELRHILGLNDLPGQRADPDATLPSLDDIRGILKDF